MNKPNVLFISSWYPSEVHPTLGNFIQKHAESVRPFVHLEVLYVTFYDGKEEKITHENIREVSTTIVYLPKRKGNIPFLSSYLSYKKYLQGFKSGLKYIEQQKGVKRFDVTHCNITFKAGLLALYLKKKYGIPYVISENWTMFLPYRNDFKKQSFFFKRQVKNIVKQVDVMLPVSEHLAKSMQNLLGVDFAYEVIPNVVDTNLFRLPEERKQGDIIQILHVSTLDNDQKNVLGMFKALKEVSLKRQDFIFTIVSDGDIEEAKRLLKKSGLPSKFVAFNGSKTPKELVSFFQAADFFLLFSNYENLPCVMTESMSCGLPFVSSAIAGVPEHITKEYGLLVEARDEKGLARAVLQMMDTLEEYDREKIRSYALSNFDYNAVGEQFVNQYKKII